MKLHKLCILRGTHIECNHKYPLYVLVFFLFVYFFGAGLSDAGEVPRNPEPRG